MPITVSSELHAALLQAAITLGLAGLCAVLYAQYRKRYFLWWAVAWSLYVLRIGAIVGFLAAGDERWLYAHQVLTGWVALALLWASLVFLHQAAWRWRYLAVALFPVVWSYIAIYRLHHFLLAAGPAVLFLSLATLWTGWVFLRYRRRVPSRGAGFLAAVLLLWGVHHLDYPLLRARGAWNPWGYYLDIVFVLAVGVGILLLVLEDLQRGLATLSVLSGDLQPRSRSGEVIDALLRRPLALPGVQGSALYVGSGGDGAASGEGEGEGEGGRFVGAVGSCLPWVGAAPTGAGRTAIARAVRAGEPHVVRAWSAGEPAREDGSTPAYAAVLPIFRGGATTGALVIVGSARDPFTALGESFLRALGQQVGAALENADLYARVEARTHELERLSLRMVQQHEEERRRISLELHDETAQVFSAVKLQLGLVREAVAPEVAVRIDRVIALVDTGIGSIRSVTSSLRPPLLDDLGILPALRALVADFRERSGVAVAFEAPPALPPLGGDAELALFRALQEALSNVARHAEARTVAVVVRVDDAAPDSPMVVLEVRDDGRGVAQELERLTRGGRMGLAGMRERLSALGGSLDLRPDGSGTGGARLTVRLPAAGGAGSAPPTLGGALSGAAS